MHVVNVDGLYPNIFGRSKGVSNLFEYSAQPRT